MTTGSQKEPILPRLDASPPPPVGSEDAPLAAAAPSGPTPDFFVVGLGASAGGMAALQAFFSGIPAGERPGMAFIVVQHLPPDRRSLLPELLGRATHLPVREIADGQPIEADAVYVVPAGSEVSLLPSGLFSRSVFASPSTRLSVIDDLFGSLAHSQQERAVAIVLSGTGGDGSTGLEVVKSHGGLVLAQDPESAEFDGMPKRAIGTGMVDYVAPPAGMYAKLKAYASHAGAGPAPAVATIEVGEDALRQIAAVLRQQVGHDFSQYKTGTVCRRLMRRLAVHQLSTVESYVRLLRESPAEASALFRELLISVTGFFRDAEVFDALAAGVLPDLCRATGGKGGVRIWVPGCATGEEAYSLAMLMAERQEKHPAAEKCQILATDLDARAVAIARTGLYAPAALTHVSPERLTRFFTAEPGGKGYRICKALREMVIFAEHDLVKDPPFSRLDLISCRNLLIYLDAELQRRLMALFHYALNPGGLLLLGTSETAGDPSSYFAPVDRAEKLYRRLDTAPGVPLAPLGRFSPSHPLPRVTWRPPERPADRAPSRMRELAERAILQQAVPTAVLIDSAGEILYVHGRAGHYLEPAPDSPGANNIFKMAREGLRPALQTLLRQVRSGEPRAQATGVRVRANGHFIRASIAVRAVSAKEWIAAPGEAAPPYFLVTLEETSQEAAGAPETGPTPLAAGGEAPPETEVRIRALLQELDAKEAHLQAAREALETSNEELMSSNEELHSINEEMHAASEELETSKEELQSVNEELYTVNAELQTKVTDLSHANNDILNLLAGTGIATIFVDCDLNVMRFTPAAARIANLIPSDVGRPIGHLALNLKEYPSLEPDARRVFEDASTITRDVQSLDGLWYSLRVLPYVTAENRFEGVAITFADITELKQAEANLAHERDLLQSVMNSAGRAHLVYLDRDFNFVRVNEAYAAACGYRPEEMVGKNHFVLYPHAENEAIFRRVRDTGQPFEVHDKPFEFPDQPERGTTWWDWTLAPVSDVGGQVTGLIFSLFETTERKMAAEDLKKLNAQLQSAVANMPNAYILWDTELRVIEWNMAAERIFGYSKEEMLGKNAADYIVPQGVRHLVAEVLQNLKVGQISDYSERDNNIRKDGALISCHWFNTPLADQEGRIFAILTQAQDITERKRAEAAVRRHDEELTALNLVGRKVGQSLSLEEVAREAATEAGRAARADFAFILMREGERLILKGVAPDGGEHGFEGVPEHRVGECMCGLAVKQGRTLWSRNICTDSRCTWEECKKAGLRSFVAVPLRDRDEIIGVIGMANHAERDFEPEIEFLETMAGLVASACLSARLYEDVQRELADRKRAEEALRESEDRLRQSDKLSAIGQLAGGIAHNFNNQLGGVMGYADLLLSKLDDERLRRYVAGILTGSRRCADLAAQLLAFSRQGKYLSMPVDLHHLIGETVALLQQSIDKRIEIHQHLDATAAVVLGDPTQLQSVLLNLGLNARDAMPKGGTLLFATKAVCLAAEEAHRFEIAPGRCLRIAVMDTGTGMSPETRKRIFEPFFTTKEQGKGTGLGLASVHGTVLNHHGAITVESEPGKGSAFTIHLPLHEEAPSEAATSGTDVPVPVAGRTCVMLVDDEQILLDVGGEILRDLGHEVITCKNGAEAVDRYREDGRRIGLVILDIVMPKMGGADAFTALRAIDPGVKVLVSSGYSIDGEARTLLDAGALGFLQKPFNRAELTRKVAEAL